MLATSLGQLISTKPLVLEQQAAHSVSLLQTNMMLESPAPQKRQILQSLLLRPTSCCGHREAIPFPQVYADPDYQVPVDTDVDRDCG